MPLSRVRKNSFKSQPRKQAVGARRHARPLVLEQLEDRKLSPSLFDKRTAAREARRSLGRNAVITSLPACDPDSRIQLMEELYQRFAGASLVSGNFKENCRFWRKKYVFLLVFGSAKTLKRSIDILFALLLLVGLVPLFLVVATLVKLVDGGPVLFWQTRVGRWGQEFEMPKFRTMVVRAEQMMGTLLTQNDHKEGLTFKMKHDPRVTWIGRILRRTSIDELPQLWSVVRGHMSLVGPRPPVPREVAHYTLADRRRLDVIPGLTCIWQVSGRSNIPFPKQVELDVRYIESQSVLFDIQLLCKTIPAILFGSGAY